MTPSLIFYFILSVLPVLTGFYYSFTDWYLGNEEISFAGFYQFEFMFRHSDFYTAASNTVKYAFTIAIFQNILGLCLALILNMRLKLKDFLRSAFFSPCIFNMLIITYTFSAILHPYGPLNNLLKSLGMEWAIKQWLVDTSINMFVISGIHIWMYMGMGATIYLAGLQSIPIDVIEASKIDGTNSWKMFANITFPLIAPSITINLVLSLIGAFKVFELPYLLSKTFAPVLNTMVYNSFATGQYGYGTALSLILFLLIFIIAVPVLITLKKREVEL
jgi:ABC-type sugar transport system permease subunit